MPPNSSWLWVSVLVVIALAGLVGTIQGVAWLGGSADGMRGRGAILTPLGIAALGVATVVLLMLLRA